MRRLNDWVRTDLGWFLIDSNGEEIGGLVIVGTDHKRYYSAWFLDADGFRQYVGDYERLMDAQAVVLGYSISEHRQRDVHQSLHIRKH